jgi:hypothetical protein
VFAIEVLGWEEPVVEPSSTDYDMEKGYRAVEVASDDSRDASAVLMFLRKVAARCWSVSWLRTLERNVERGTPTEIGVSHAEGITQLTFDLNREAAGREVAIVSLTVGSQEVRLTASEFEEQAVIELNQEPSKKPTFFLVLLEGTDGEVVGAIGQALPAGNFTAG